MSNDRKRNFPQSKYQDIMNGRGPSVTGSRGTPVSTYDRLDPSTASRLARYGDTDYYQQTGYPQYSLSSRSFVKHRYKQHSGNLKQYSHPTAGQVSAKFAQRTSLQGIPLINSSKRWYAKTFWSVVFLIATGAFAGHAFYIISNYMSFGTTSKVSIKYTLADFPSVTLCNINPLRNSSVAAHAPDILKNFVTSVVPVSENGGGSGGGSDDQSSSDSGDQTGGQGSQGDDSTTAQVDSSGQTGVTSVDFAATTLPEVTSVAAGNQNVQSGRRKLLQASDTDYQYDEYYYQYSYYAGESDFHAYKDPIDWTYLADNAVDNKMLLLDNNTASGTKVTAALQELTADLSDGNRTIMGHNFTTMLMSCTYDGTTCGAQNFTRRLDIEYGNCWTFNSASRRNRSLVSKLSGAKFGLDLILFTDDREYLQGFQLGRGIRLQLHQFKTMPFVAEHGMSVKPGQEVYIAFRLLKQTRLGGVYGQCDDKGSFKTYYNNTFDYSLITCINTCLDRTIASTCKCYRKTRRNLYSIADLNKLQSCSTKDATCVSRLNAEFLSRKLDCGCQQACNTSAYETNESYNQWPEESLWTALTDSICKKDISYCDYFKNIPTEQRFAVLQKNFVHVKIYYKELNVQSIDEVPDYPAPQFASDLGGCIGLWIGATFITIMEILEYFYELSTVCCRKKRVKQPVTMDTQQDDSVASRDTFKLRYY